MVNSQFSWDSLNQNKTLPRDEDLQKNPGIQRTEKIAEKDKSWGSLQTPATFQSKSNPEDEESSLGWLARNAISNTFRYAEAIGGRYGNIQEFFSNVLSSVPQSTGLLGKALHDFIGQENWDRAIFGINPEMKGGKLPTSQDLKKGTIAATGEYTKPKNKGEKAIQELASDVGSLGRGRQGPIRERLIHNLGIPAAANAAKQAVEYLGFGEDAGTWTKLASWLGLSLLNGVNGNNFASGLMNQGRNGFTPNQTANIPRYENAVAQVERQMLHNDPGSTLARQQIAGIRQDLQNGQISIPDLMNRYDAINREKRSRDLFNLNRTDRAAARRNINQVLGVVRQEIQHAGAANPQALQAWNQGVQAWSVIHQSNAMTNWIQNTMTGPYAKFLAAPVSALFGVGGYGAYKAPFVAGTAAATIPAAYKSGQIAYRVWNDPQLARYYWEAINAARQQNQGVFIKNFNDLNRAYERKFGKSAVANSK